MDGGRCRYIHIAFAAREASPKTVRVLATGRLQDPVVDVSSETPVQWAGPMPGHVILRVPAARTDRYMGVACTGHYAESWAPAARPVHHVTLLHAGDAGSLEPALLEGYQRLEEAAAATAALRTRILPPATRPPAPPSLPLRPAATAEEGPSSSADSIGSSAPQQASKLAAGGPPPPPPLPKLLSKAPAAPAAAAAAAGPGSAPPPPPLPLKLPGKGLKAATAVSGPEPKRPLVRLFWSKLTSPEAKGTVWGLLKSAMPGPMPPGVQLDFAELEEQFEARQPAAASHTSARLAAALAANKDASRLAVLPVQRANGVGIWLAKNKLGPQEAGQLLGDICYGRRINDCPLSCEALEGFFSLLPNQEESVALRRHFRAQQLDEGESQQRVGGSDLEAFVYSVISIPDYEDRLRAVQFKLQLDERLTALGRAVQQLGAACDEVERSRDLQAVLKVVLAVGNFMNHGGKVGGASGFRVDALPKLKLVRATRGQRDRTLLHFIAAQLAKWRPAAPAASSGSADSSVPGSSGLFSLRAALPCLETAPKLRQGLVRSLPSPAWRP